MKKKCPVCLCAVDAKDLVCNFCKTPLARSIGTSDLSTSFKPPTVVFDKKPTSNPIKKTTGLLDPTLSEKTKEELVSNQAFEQKNTQLNINKTVKEDIANHIQKLNKSPEFTENKIEKKQEVKFDDIETPLKNFDFEHHLKEENQEQKTGKLINFERIITQVKALERNNQINTPVTKDMLTSTKPRNFLQDTFDIKLDALGFIEEDLNFKDLKKHVKASLNRETSDKYLEESKKEEVKRKHFEVLKRIMRERKKKLSLNLISISPYYIAPFEIENLEIEEIKKSPVTNNITEEIRTLEVDEVKLSEDIIKLEDNNESFLEVEIADIEVEPTEPILPHPDFSESEKDNEQATHEEKPSFFISENIINNISVDTFNNDVQPQVENDLEIRTIDEQEKEKSIPVENSTLKVEEEPVAIEVVSADISENLEKSNDFIEDADETNTDNLEPLESVSFDFHKKEDTNLNDSIFLYNSEKTLDIFVPIDKDIIFQTQSLSDLVAEKLNTAEKEKDNSKIEEVVVLNQEKEHEVEEIKEVVQQEVIEETHNSYLILEPLKNTGEELNEAKIVEINLKSEINETVPLIVNKTFENIPILPKIDMENEPIEVNEALKNRLKRFSKKSTDTPKEVISEKVSVEIKQPEVNLTTEIKNAEKDELGLVRYKIEEKPEVKIVDPIKKDIEVKNIPNQEFALKTTLNIPTDKLISCPPQQGARGSTDEDALEYYNIARDLCVKKNYVDALKKLETCVKIDPAFEQAHILLSRTYLKLKSSGHIEVKP